jgi:hypothetical protein
VKKPAARRAGHRRDPRRDGTLAYHITASASLQCSKKISTLISDVATSRNSGSGVFDAGNKCLLGIVSLFSGAFD